MALDNPLDIRGCRLHEVNVPLVEPFQISGGTMAVRRSLIIEIEDAGGGRGYGESAPFLEPFYSEETLASVRAVIESVLFPRLVGHRFDSLAGAVAAMVSGVRGNRFARAGVETALWDLACALAGVTLSGLIAAILDLAELGSLRERDGLFHFLDIAKADGAR